MESLLRWGIENTGKGEDGGPPPPAPRKDLDPAIIDYILGRPDSELMKEALTKAKDEELSDEARISALDDLEMLVESIDNANDLQKLQMWEPIQSLLTSTSTPDEIKIQTLWVLGTAVQNNPAAQKAYLALEPISAILSFLSRSVRSSQLRSKAVYALSGLLRHNAPALDQLERAGGWDVLRSAVEDSDISVRRKTAFLLGTLLLPAVAVGQAAPQTRAPLNGAGLHSSDTQPANPAPVHANSHASMLSDPSSVDTAPATVKALRDRGLLPALIHELVSPTPHGPDGDSEGDLDLEEKIMRLLHTYVTVHRGEFSADEKRQLRDFIAQKEKSAQGWDNFSLHEELRVLQHALQ